MLTLVPKDFVAQVAPLYRSPIKIMHRVLRSGTRKLLAVLPVGNGVLMLSLAMCSPGRVQMAAQVMEAFRDFQGGEIGPDGQVLADADGNVVLE